MQQHHRRGYFPTVHKNFANAETKAICLPLVKAQMNFEEIVKFKSKAQKLPTLLTIAQILKIQVCPLPHSSERVRLRARAHEIITDHEICMDHDNNRTISVSGARHDMDYQDYQNRLDS